MCLVWIFSENGILMKLQVHVHACMWHDRYSLLKNSNQNTYDIILMMIYIKEIIFFLSIINNSIAKLVLKMYWMRNCAFISISSMSSVFILHFLKIDIKIYFDLLTINI